MPLYAPPTDGNLTTTVDTLGNSTANNFGGSSTFSVSTGVSPPDYALSSGSAGNVAAAFTLVDGSITTLQGNVTTLQGNVTTLQGNVTTLQGNVTALQGNVTALQGNVTALQGNVTALQGNVTTLQGNVTTLQGNTSSLESDISALRTAPANTDPFGQSVAATIGGGALYANSLTAMTPPSFSVQGSTVHNVGSAVGLINSSITGILNSIAAASTIASNGLGSGRNRILNADMQIDVRNNFAPHTITPTLGYTCDRFQAGTAGANATGQVVPSTAGNGTYNAYMVTGAAGVTNSYLRQRIISSQCRDLGGYWCTLSFYGMAVGVPQINITVFNGITAMNSVATQTFNVTSTYSRYTIAFLMPTVTDGITLTVATGAVLAGSYWAATGLQMEICANQATPAPSNFEVVPFTDLFYYCAWYSTLTRGGSGMCVSGSGTNYALSFVYPTTFLHQPPTVVAVAVPGTTFKATLSNGSSVTTSNYTISSVINSGAVVVTVTSSTWSTPTPGVGTPAFDVTSGFLLIASEVP